MDKNNNADKSAAGQDILFPRPLKEGDLIVICSPAGPIAAEKVEGARRVLEKEGWRVRVSPHALGRSGNYSGTDAERLSDLTDALTDPEVRAVICSRGGYGVVHLMQQLSGLDLRKDPKWVVGFSDISALHALMATRGVASVHASMTDHIRRGPSDPDNALLFDILRGGRRPVSFPANPLDRPGIASGRLLGGNLAVLAGLIDTDYDIIRPDTVLFIEDIAEPIYKTERILYQLRLSGVWGKLAGLMVGQFTDYRADASYRTMEDMISDMTAPYSYPVAFNVPVGHVEHNVPMIESCRVTLRVGNGPSNSLVYWH